LCGEGREDGFAGCCRKFIRLFLCRFENGSSRDRIGRLYSREYVVAVIEKFYHAFARVTQIKLADKDTLNAFLDLKDGIVRVLPMFVGLKGQFVDPVEDLLLGSGPCRVACFRHGGVVRSLGRN
jgi:hypothetical protein